MRRAGGNAAQLRVAWSYPIAGNSIFNPVVVDGVMYAPVGGGALAAIDAATGTEIWRKEGAAPSGARGMNYWESPDRSDRRFIYLHNAGGARAAGPAPDGPPMAGAAQGAQQAGGRQGPGGSGPALPSAYIAFALPQ